MPTSRLYKPTISHSAKMLLTLLELIKDFQKMDGILFIFTIGNR